MWQGERVKKKKNESSEILIPGFNPSLTHFSTLSPSLSLFSPMSLFCDEEIATTKEKKKTAHFSCRSLLPSCQHADVNTKAFLCDLSMGLRGGDRDGRRQGGKIKE